MSNILILNGAPRRNGLTASLVKAFTEGAIASGNEVREAYIQGMDVKNCLGCDACMKTHAGCVQKDEGMARIYEDLDWCDTVVFASPVYFGYLTAQLKAVIDRMWAWFNLPSHFGAKRRTVLISTARGTDYSLALQQYGVYSILGWEDLGHVLGAGKEDEARRLGGSLRAKVLAACGNDCASCPRYVTHPYEKSPEELLHTAELWMRIGYRDHVATIDEISCKGCRPSNWCRYHVIECCLEKGIETCAECPGYPCENMAECFEVTRSFEPACRQACSDGEYELLRRAFFEKEKNLAEAGGL